MRDRSAQARSAEAGFDLRRLQPKDGAANLWLLGLADAAGLEREHALLLSAEEIARAERFLRAEDRRRFILTRAALRSLLGAATGRGPKDIAFATGANGKPYLADDSGPHFRGPHFNVSHSGAHALIGISDRPIGVDIELMRDNLDELELARSFYCADEHEFLSGLAGAARIEGFYKIWTCKEAVLKAFGVGITTHLKDFSVELTFAGYRVRPHPNCFSPALGAIVVEPVEIPSGYAAAIALA